FTQAPVQFINPAEQPVVLQWDWSQTEPAAQTFVQVPQCWGLDAVSTQLDPHATSVPWHWHIPSVQVWPVVHLVPQLPQLLTSLLVSTQALPQVERPTAH